MKQKIKKIVILSAILLVSVFFFRCQNDEYLSKTESTDLASVKTWFDDYKAKEEFHPAFKNIEYHWEIASIVKLENDSEAIVVPMKDSPENPDYKGKKILYLYLADSGYEAVVHEIFSKSEDVSLFVNEKEDFQNQDSFSGYILTWNLKEGFVKGAEFENGLVVKNISSAIILSDDEKVKAYNQTRKAPAAAPIELDNVSVTGGTGGGGCGGCGGVIRFTPTLGGGSIGGGTGGYMGSPHSGSGAGTGTPSAPEAKDDLPPSCRAFEYSNVTSNWQTAATKNIVALIGYYDVATGDYNIASVLYAQPIYFEMPINSASNGGYISSGRAAELTALALQTAISRAKYYFLSTSASSSQVQAKLWEYIRDEMANGAHIVGGRASFTPPLNFKGQTIDYKSYWFLPDNCN